MPPWLIPGKSSRGRPAIEADIEGKNPADAVTFHDCDVQNDLKHRSDGLAPVDGREPTDGVLQHLTLQDDLGFCLVGMCGPDVQIWRPGRPPQAESLPHLVA